MQRRHGGFSLVELMVAVALAVITGLVVLQVLSSYQTRKTTTVGRNDAEINAALGLYSLEREIRMAGAGLTTPSGMYCNNGINIYYNGPVFSDGAPLRPLRIIDGGAGPDTIQILRSDSDFGAAPTALVQSMATPMDTIVVDGTAALASGNLMLLGSQDGSKLCTLMQLTSAPTANGTSYNLVHASATSNYNPADPAGTFTTAIAYSVTDTLVNMGTIGLLSYGVICNDGAAPSASNNCDLAWYDQLATPTPLTLATVQSIAPQVIELQAQYGVAPVNSQTITEWDDATGATWATPSAADQRRIKAVRIAIVTRGSHEATQVSPATLLLWPADATLGSPQRVRALTAAERYYRYQVLTVIVPLINVIWAGV